MDSSTESRFLQSFFVHRVATRMSSCRFVHFEIMNVYDSDKMLDVLGDSHGMQVTHNIDEADVLLMNTCSIREKAQEKVFSELGRWRKLKEKRPDLVIGVGGCVASQEGDNIQKRAPYVDMVFGPQTLHRLPELYDQSNDQRHVAPKNRIVSLVDQVLMILL